MSDKTKNMIIYSVMAIVIALFLYAIFVGNKVKQQETEEKVEVHQPVSNEQTQLVRDYGYDEKQIQENKEANNEPTVEEQHDEFDIEIPVAETMEEPEGDYTDYFPIKDVEKSRKTAKRFTKSLYAFSGQEPLTHVENAKPYMTDEMYEALKKKGPRPTAAIHHKEVEKIDVYEPYDPSKEQLIWKVRVKGSVYDSNGNKTAEERKDYTIKTTKVKGTFKVENYMLNVPY